MEVTRGWPVHRFGEKIRSNVFTERKESEPDSGDVRFIELIHVSGHCHGPACLSMQLYDADTGELLCETAPIYGASDAAMDEDGYSVRARTCGLGSCVTL